MGKMEEPDQGGDLSFADLWDAEYLEEFKGHFQSAIKEQAQDMDLHAWVLSYCRSNPYLGFSTFLGGPRCVQNIENCT